MISIVNITPNATAFAPNECEYEVKVNSRLIVRFKHKRTDGLARCLLEAAKAVGRDQAIRAVRESGLLDPPRPEEFRNPSYDFGRRSAPSYRKPTNEMTPEERDLKEFDEQLSPGPGHD